ncbi:MAG: HNH endonuclease [Oceanicaulis sp.]|uniref:HNH endonuclease n=1 Tax=Glycocaulis sp. TaxID=1969725 RepID=UPI0025BEAAD6|nr:HNH endonuclease [Glycocaulis sp.]MCC5980530.1 HNH endonuclease [Oceanicaulis sp.]MCH8521493.1 HNH endonuclease [Glycocaulis sp.]
MHISTNAPADLRCLVLNADYQPLSYYPLSTWPWQEAIKAVFLERVDVVSEYETQIRSPSFAMHAPSVVALRDFVHQDRPPAFTRFNVFLRDGFTCQYCGSNKLDLLTFDHVVPRSKGGRTTWENIVAACAPCNLKKGGRTPREASMPTLQLPERPSMHRLQSQGRRFPPKYLHESWLDYLYWDVELEP